MAIEMGEDFPGFAPSAIAAIEAHDWPGNVRELRNFAQRLAHRSMVMTPGEPVVFDPAALDPFESPWRPQIITWKAGSSAKTLLPAGERSRQNRSIGHSRLPGTGGSL
jgi:psp operon transcriptional activator